jgi:hypothetical protein
MPFVIIGGILILVLGGGSWWALATQKDPEPADITVQAPDNPAETTPAAADVTPEAPTANEVQPAASDTADTASNEAVDGTTSNTEDGSDSEATGNDSNEPAKPIVVPASGADWTLPAAGEPIHTTGIIDFKLIRLDEVPPLEKWEGSSDEDWADIQEDLLLFLDDSGAQSNRAGKRLVEDYPRGAYPAIVNAMMKADFENEDGLYMLSALNDLIVRIGKNTNLGWDSTTGKEVGSEEWNKAVLYNKKVVAGWQRLWVDKYSVDDAAWESFASSVVIKKPKDEPKPGTGGVVGPEEDPFD